MGEDYGEDYLTRGNAVEAVPVIPTPGKQHLCRTIHPFAPVCWPKLLDFIAWRRYGPVMTLAVPYIMSCVPKRLPFVYLLRGTCMLWSQKGGKMDPKQGQVDEIHVTYLFPE